MAEKNEYKLTIELVGTAEQKQSTTASTDGTSEKSSAKEEQKNGNASFLKGVAVYHFAKNIADKYLSNQVNTITLRTGFEEKQAREQMLYGFLTRGVNVAESVVVGAMTGGGAGALVGLAVGLVGQAVDMGITAQNVSISRDVEATQIFLNSIRMGAGINRGNGR